MNNIFKELKKLADSLSLPCEVRALYVKGSNENIIRIWWFKHNYTYLILFQRDDKR